MTFYKIIRAILAGFFRVLYRVHVTGEDNIPDSGAVIISPNHASAADPILLAVVARRPIRFMGKAELFRIPLLGWILKALGAFPVHRNEGDVAAIKKSLAILSDGEMLCVFTQGTRCPGVPVRETADKVKSGVGLLTMRSGADVVPVYIKTKANRPRMFRRTDVIFGEVIKSDEFSELIGRTKYSDAAMMIFDRICALGEQGEDSE